MDPSFPPAPKSLYYPGGCESELGSSHVVKWLRPQDINTRGHDSNLDWVVFRTPRSSDISQGNAENYLVYIVRFPKKSPFRAKCFIMLIFMKKS